MKAVPEILALKQFLALCQAHAEALLDALNDIRQRPFEAFLFDHLPKADQRLFDQFAYRYTRLQDDMGVRLMPSVLRALGEEVAAMPALDRFARLEQLGLLCSADDWRTLRQIRNEFAHDYPDSSQERVERLAAALLAADQLLNVLTHLTTQLKQRFGEAI